MSESADRKEQARAMAARLTPLAQQLSDYIFSNPEYQKLGHGTTAAAMIVMGAALFKFIGMKAGDVVLLAEAAFEDTWAEEKDGQRQPVGPTNGTGVVPLGGDPGVQGPILSSSLGSGPR